MEHVPGLDAGGAAAGFEHEEEGVEAGCEAWDGGVRGEGGVGGVQVSQLGGVGL